ncbi:MAG: hypothetical protein KGI06_00740 [Candidatus Micrarchaeota archaeon]|nr:hypothetical protein [Candidatus Micrarchaeota archaeon]
MRKVVQKWREDGSLTVKERQILGRLMRVMDAGISVSERQELFNLPIFRKGESKPGAYGTAQITGEDNVGKGTISKDAATQIDVCILKIYKMRNSHLFERTNPASETK